jgi:hypothetical protein
MKCRLLEAAFASSYDSFGEVVSLIPMLSRSYYSASAAEFVQHLTGSRFSATTWPRVSQEQQMLAAPYSEGTWARTCFETFLEGTLRKQPGCKTLAPMFMWSSCSAFDRLAPGEGRRDDRSGRSAADEVESRRSITKSGA